MRIARVLLLWWVAHASAVGPAQGDAGALEASYGVGRLLSTDGVMTPFERITIGEDVHTVLPPNASRPHTIPAATVSRIEIRDGSRAMVGALGGAGAGLVTSLIGIAIWNSGMGQDSMDGDVATLIAGGSTVVMGLVGWWIGSSLQTYTTVFEAQDLSFMATPYLAGPSRYHRSFRMGVEVAF